MIDSLKPYPAYKPSGMEWLGDVPKHWEVRPNRALFAEMMERDHPDEQMLSVTITKGVIRQQALLAESSKKDSSNQDRTAYKLVRPGDIVYNKMRAWQGAVGVSDYQGIVSPAYVVVRPREGHNPRYFHHLLRTPAFAKEAERWSYGITSDQWSLRPEHFKMIYCLLPPLPEQSAIVRFLDHVDRSIRRYIRAKQKLIALLNEQKQAIIQRAVTGQIDVRTGKPYPAYKPSGVEWLGEVPEHWEVMLLGAAASSIQTGPFGSQLHASEYVIGGTPVINPSHIRGGLIHADPKISVNAVKGSKLDRHKLRTGDVIAARRGDLGRCALVRNGQEGWLCGTGSLRIRPRHEMLIPAYLVQVLSSSGVRKALSRLSIGATMDNLNASMMARLRVPVPPLQEQGAIMEYIARESLLVQSALSTAQREITLLREFRTRLIADVVTGKLDVREVALLPEEAEESEPLDDTDADAEGGEETEATDLDTSSKEDEP